MTDDDILSGFILRVPKGGGGWDDVDATLLDDAQIEWVLMSSNDPKHLRKLLEGCFMGMKHLAEMIVFLKATGG